MTVSMQKMSIVADDVCPNHIPEVGCWHSIGRAFGGDPRDYGNFGYPKDEAS